MLWAQEKNLKLNRAKSTEIVFTDSRRKSQFSPPPTLPDVSRVSLIKILGVTISNHLSVSDHHIRDVISKCAQSLFAFKVLRCHGMNNEALEQIYKRLSSQSSYTRRKLGGDSLRPQISSALKRLSDVECATVSTGLAIHRRRNPCRSQRRQPLQQRTNKQQSRSQTACFPTKATINTISDRHRRHTLTLSIKTDARNFVVRQLFRDTY